MSIRYLKKYAALEGSIAVEDAETLAVWMRGQKSPKVHLGKCEHLHAAVLQVLMSHKPAIVSGPDNPFFAKALGIPYLVVPSLIKESKP